MARVTVLAVLARALLALALALAAHEVLAERADRDKPVQIESDRMEYDDLKRISIFVGRVVLTKGSLVIRGDRLVVREDGDGFRYAQAEGKPANFRQKREGLDEFIEGLAQTIEYDGKTESAVLTEGAQMRRLEREKVLDEVRGARITYLSGSERYTVEGALPGATPGERVRMVIQPRRSAESPGGTTAAPSAPAGKSATPLTPADRLGTPGRQGSGTP